MDSINSLKIKIIKTSGILLILIFISTVFFMDGAVPYFNGLIFGYLISVLNFIDLANTMTRASIMSPGQAQIFASLKYFIRFAVTGLVVFISIKADYINVLGTIIGLLVIKLVIIFTQALTKTKRKEGN